MIVRDTATRRNIMSRAPDEHHPGLETQVFATAAAEEGAAATTTAAVELTKNQVHVPVEQAVSDIKTAGDIVNIA